MTDKNEEQVRAERARTVGLFRYALIRDAADPALTTKQRGRLVRALARTSIKARSGSRCGPRGPRSTGGSATGAGAGSTPWFPSPRQTTPRTPAEVLELAVGLKREVPERTAAQVAAILRAHAGWAPDERTLQRHFARLELTTRPNGQPPQGVRPVRGGRPERAVDRGRVARPHRRRAEGDLVRVHR